MAISLPHNIAADTLMDATEIEANFDAIEAQAVALAGANTLTGILTTVGLLPTADATSDLGTAAKQYKDLYLSGSVIGPGAPDTFKTIAVAGQSDVAADSATDTLTLVAGTGVAITTAAGTDTITFTPSNVLDAGSSAIDAASGGTIYNAHTAVGNVGAGVDTLYTQALAAALLATDGDALHFSFAGSFAANANNKRLILTYGATAFLDMGAGVAPNNKIWTITGSITRVSATSQVVQATLLSSAVSTFETALCTQGLTTAAETLSGAVTLLLTGEATTTNDIVMKLARVWTSPDNPN